MLRHRGRYMLYASTVICLGLIREGDKDVSITRFDMTHGFVVAGKDTARFLQEKLAFMGSTPKKTNLK